MAGQRIKKLPERHRVPRRLTPYEIYWLLLGLIVLIALEVKAIW